MTPYLDGLDVVLLLVGLAVPLAVVTWEARHDR